MLQTIATYSSIMEANLEKSYLEGADIDCHLANEFMVSIDPLLSNAVGGIELKVPEKDVERALEILAHVRSTLERDEHNQILQCPRCGSEDLGTYTTAFSSWKGFVASLVAFAFASLPVHSDKSTICNQCKTKFSKKKKD